MCKYVKLTPGAAGETCQSHRKGKCLFIKAINDNEGVLTTKGNNQLGKMRDNTLKSILDDEQIQQYWRGVYNAEAMAEGAAIANTLQKKYGLTDQNWKFINVAFYKMLLTHAC